MKKMIALAVALMLLMGSALAFSPDRFAGLEGVTVEYDEAEPSTYMVKAGFEDKESWEQFGGHTVIRYSNAGKGMEIPLILVGFTSSDVKASNVRIRTDAHEYTVVCTDLTRVGLNSIESEATVLISAASMEMFEDIVNSTYTRISIWSDNPEECFVYDLEDEIRPVLKVFMEEFTGQVAAMVSENGTLTAVYSHLNPQITREEVVNIGQQIQTIQTIQYVTLQNGSKGESVAFLQRALISCGYLEGAADGTFGSGTEKALTQFQKDNGLPETGIADAETQTALYILTLEAE